MKRYTRKSLEALVDYANQVVPPCDGCMFIVYADGLGCAVRQTPISVESWQRELYVGRFTPREAASKFLAWLLGSTCPREVAWAVADFAAAQGVY